MLPKVVQLLICHHLCTKLKLTETYKITSYIRKAYQKYFPSIIDRLNSIMRTYDDAMLNTEQSQGAARAASSSFNTMLDWCAEEINNSSTNDARVLYSITYLYIFAYKLHIVSPEDLDYNQEEYLAAEVDIRKLYAELVQNTSNNVSLLDMVLAILGNYIFIVDKSLLQEQDSFLGAGIASANSLNNNAEHNIADLGGISYLIVKYKQLVDIRFSDELSPAINLIRCRIVSELVRESPRYNIINQLIKLYIGYQARFIEIHNRVLTYNEESSDFFARLVAERRANVQQADTIMRLDAYLALDKELDTIFKYYLDFWILLNENDIELHAQLIKLLSIANKIQNLTVDNPAVLDAMANNMIMYLAQDGENLQSLHISQYRYKIIRKFAEQVLLVTERQDIKKLVENIYSFSHYLNSDELKDFLNCIQDWQANFSGSVLQSVLKCKLSLEMQYVDSLRSFEQLIRYYDYIDDKILYLPKSSLYYNTSSITSEYRKNDAYFIAQCVHANTKAMITPDMTSDERRVLRKIESDKLSRFMFVTLAMPEVGVSTIEDQDRKSLASHNMKLREYVMQRLEDLNPAWYKVAAVAVDNNSAYPNPVSSIKRPIQPYNGTFTIFKKKADSASGVSSDNNHRGRSLSY